MTVFQDHLFGAARTVAGVLVTLLLAPIWSGVEPVHATCLPMASAPPPIIRASFSRQVAVAPYHLGITFVGHASFMIESAEGVRVLTDYNGYVEPPVPPDVVTMNNSHDSHYTEFVDKSIKNVLRGWDPKGGIARHNLLIKDMRIRNVPTNLNDWNGRLSNGNSMFVFESADLCVVHISHLHHVLSKDQLRDLGRIDIAFAPIDGQMTMSHQELFEVLAAIKPMLIIPMHYGFGGAVEAFIERARHFYPIRQHDSATIEVSFKSLPRKPEVLFLQGR